MVEKYSGLRRCADHQAVEAVHERGSVHGDSISRRDAERGGILPSLPRAIRCRRVRVEEAQPVWIAPSRELLLTGQGIHRGGEGSGVPALGGRVLLPKSIRFLLLLSAVAGEHERRRKLTHSGDCTPEVRRDDGSRGAADACEDLKRNPAAALGLLLGRVAPCDVTDLVTEHCGELVLAVHDCEQPT